MKSEYAPEHLNVAAFARASGVISGEEMLSRFERLRDETQGPGDATAVVFSAFGEIRHDGAGAEEIWMHLQARTVLALTCQRCLGPVDVPVEFSRDFRFVLTEELAEIEDEESEEDVLVLQRNFNVLELIEDELLMAMPPAPKHEKCQEVVNPFAVLEQLKKKIPPQQS